jgi:ectoine hydroxylase-related dioxygenase (phytanoyl-CoA dioxygenase family)
MKGAGGPSRPSFDRHPTWALAGAASRLTNRESIRNPVEPEPTMNSVPSATSATAPPRDVLDQARASFAENGYVVLPGLVPAAPLAELHAALLAAYEQARADGRLFQGGGLMAGHLNCFPGEAARWVYRVLEERGVIDLVRELSPKVARLPNVGCNFNLPGSAVQHYHTDSDFTKDFMIVNVAAVDTDIQNGATDVVPGTHRRFYKYWRFALENPARGAVRVPLRRGDVLVRSSVTWHRGMPNRSPAPRPMLAFTWEDGGSAHADPFALEGGRIAFRPNWFRPTPLGRLRERVFLAAPITYGAYRFVRSLVGNKGY